MGVRQSSLRAMNLATVLNEIFAAPTPVSRADIAGNTGLARPTVSRLVDELIEHALATEIDPVAAGQRGRPAIPLAPASGRWFGLGLEVNITHLAACLVDLGGSVAGELIQPFDSAGSPPDEALRQVSRMGRSLIAKLPTGARLAGVSLALPGLVDAARAVLLRAPNLGWWNVEPVDPVAETLGIDPSLITLGNEADFAALTVARTSPGRPSRLTDYLYVSGEVGIGSALVSGGQPTTGRHGWAGEIGHMSIDPDGIPCPCGSQGCLERYVGQQALLTAAGVDTFDDLQAALHSGNPRASKAVLAAARLLGVALANALNLLDLSFVTLGGHLGKLSDYLLPVVRAELSRRVLSAPFAPFTIEAITQDPAPAARGAAYSAAEVVLHDPASWIDAEHTNPGPAPSSV